MSDIDIVAIQQEAEEIARAEYRAAWDRLEKSRNEIEMRDAKWRMVVSRLGGDDLKDGEVQDLDAVIDRVLETVTELEKLKKMFKLIHENEILESQWKRLVASIRLVGGDQA